MDFHPLLFQRAGQERVQSDFRRHPRSHPVQRERIDHIFEIHLSGFIRVIHGNILERNIFQRDLEWKRFPSENRFRYLKILNQRHRGILIRRRTVHTCRGSHSGNRSSGCGRDCFFPHRTDFRMDAFQCQAVDADILGYRLDECDFRL